MEILRQLSDPPTRSSCPSAAAGWCGHRGYVKSLYPKVRIVGVEPEDAASMHDSLLAGERVTLARVGIFADGVAVRRVGEETFRLAKQYVDEVSWSRPTRSARRSRTSSRTPHHRGARRRTRRRGIKRYVAREGCTGKTLVSLNCGANINFDRLRHVAERADLGAGREALLAVEIPEEPGSFLRFCSCSAGAASPSSTTATTTRAPRASSSASRSTRGGARSRPCSTRSRARATPCST